MPHGRLLGWHASYATKTLVVKNMQTNESVWDVGLRDDHNMITFIHSFNIKSYFWLIKNET